MNIRVKSAAIFAGLCTVSLFFASAKHIVRGGEFQPIIVTTVKSFTAGSTIPVDVTTQGSAGVTIYSDPVNAVAGSGSISGTYGEIDCSTDSTYTGEVTVYAITDGETYVDTTTSSVPANGPGGPMGIR